MSDKTDVTVNENNENETTEVVAIVTPLNLKIAKIAVASFTAGVAVAALLLKVRGANSDDTVDVHASEDTLIVTDAQQD